MLSDDAQIIDRLSGGWVRGRTAIEAYLDGANATTSDDRSQLRALRVTSWGDVAAATLAVNQVDRVSAMASSLT